MGSEDNFFKRTASHMPAWMVAILACVTFSPGLRRDIMGGFVAADFLSAVGLAVAAALLAVIASMFGSALSSWICDLYARNNKKPWLFIAAALVVWVVVVWFALNGGFNISSTSSFE